MDHPGLFPFSVSGQFTHETVQVRRFLSRRGNGAQRARSRGTPVSLGFPAGGAEDAE